MANGKDSFGMAWLILCSVAKNIASLPLEILDFSGCTLEPSKLFLLLSFLPAGTQELKFGPGVVQEEALPLLQHFLQERQQNPSSKEEGADSS